VPKSHLKLTGLGDEKISLSWFKMFIIGIWFLLTSTADRKD